MFANISVLQLRTPTTFESGTRDIKILHHKIPRVIKNDNSNKINYYLLSGLEPKVRSSYPLGSCPNLGLKINIRHYD